MPNRYIPAKTKRKLKELAKDCCEYCKALQKYNAPAFACEHIIPFVTGGTNDIENLANSCLACNFIKYTATEAIDPITNELVPLFHPRQDDWNNHFKWSDDLLTIEGLTPIGRATIIRLKMNRTASINIRQVTIGKGHPPD